MLVFTLGDPYSVNVELAHPWLAGEPARDLLRAGVAIAIVGSWTQWLDQEQRLQRQPLHCEHRSSLLQAGPGSISFIDIDPGGRAVAADQLTSQERGRIAVAALAVLRHLPPPSQPLAVVTGPIDKHACHAAGFGFPGQTEFFADLWQAPAIMTLAGPRLRVGLVTNHLPLAAVPALIDTELVEQKLSLFVKTLRQAFGLAAPRVAVCGLNPHASDHGLFGDQEARVIAPAIAAVRTQTGVEIVGPLPADTVFYRCFHGHYDGVLAMYHDQGLGPLKTVHFDEAVNLSGGLPHLRVSPDHGPAADLFLQERASPRSFERAFELAANFVLKERR